MLLLSRLIQSIRVLDRTNSGFHLFGLRVVLLNQIDLASLFLLSEHQITATAIKSRKFGLNGILLFLRDVEPRSNGQILDLEKQLDDGSLKVHLLYSSPWIMVRELFWHFESGEHASQNFIVKWFSDLSEFEVVLLDCNSEL